MNRIGVDIVEIARIENAIARWRERFLRRIYTSAEIELCSSRPHSLAGRFAAKEAVMKALGCGFKGAPWREIEILADSEGMPLVNLTGRARARADHLGIKQVLVSLSHSNSQAIAYAHAG